MPTKKKAPIRTREDFHMALPLVDGRYKLPIDLDAVLESIAEEEGREKSVIAREFIERALLQRLAFPRRLHSKLDEIGMVSLLRDQSAVVGRK